VLRVVPALHATVQREAPGTRLAELRDDRYVAALGPLAEALARLHGAGAGGLARYSLAAEARTIEQAGETVAALLPALGAEARRLASAIAAAVADADRGEAVPIHGDFYDDQALVDSRSATLLDLDEAQLGDARLDVASFLAHQTARGDDEPARTTLLEAYEACRPGSAEGVELLEAGGLLRLAVGPFRRLEPEWPDGVERLVRLAGRRFAEADAALPQLRRLLDRRAMSGLLGSAVTDVGIVRHRPARRCTLRYDLLAGGGGRVRRVYAKTFAGARAPRVHAALVSLHGTVRGVSLPAPLALVPSLNLVVQSEVDAAPVLPSLLEGDEETARLVADAAHALHRSGAALMRVHGLEDELRPLARRVERLAAADRTVAPQAERCFALSYRATAAVSQWRQLPVHRDLYPDQVRHDGSHVAFLDLDDAAMAEPALDIANFAAHLRLAALEHPGAGEPLAASRTAFVRRARDLDAGLDPELVRVLEGMTLLRLADIHRVHAHALLAESERLLDGG
jgi:aminoglycoside phosphotransferase (APT) family kinase protein